VTFQSLLLLTIVVNNYRGLPLALVILGVLAIGIHLLTTQTPFGRYLYAIGGNEEAAVVSGVPVRGTVIGAFALMGLIVALTGFMQTAYSGATTTTIGSLMELDAIAACVIGGTSLFGGRGKVRSAILGAVVIAMIDNGLGLVNVSAGTKFVVTGIVLLAAVTLDSLSRRRSEASGLA